MPRSCATARARAQRTARELLAQRLARDVFTRDEDLPIEFLEGIDRRDSRMGQRRGGTGFAPKPLPAAFVAGEPRRQGLQRDRPAQPHVFGEIDDAHAALAEHPLDPVLADLPAGERRLGAVPALVEARRRLGRLFDEIGRALVTGEERGDFPAQLVVAAARVGEKRVTRVRRLLEGAMKEVVDAPPGLGVERPR
jgi:hypothetical protein